MRETNNEVKLLALAAIALRDLDGVEVLPEIPGPTGHLQAAPVARLWKTMTC